jgi:Ni/Fe-hydrogenase subunit HybB-like protein
MDNLVLQLLGIVVVLGVGITVITILGMRYIAYRIAGQRGTVSIPDYETFPIPTIRIVSRRKAIRTFLLVVLAGVGVGLILMRFMYGIGSISNLSDQFAWGLWIGVDVMSGIALAAGAFVIAAAVYIFRLKRFEPLVRPAILTGLLGYLLECGVMAVEVGRPYNFWRLLVHWEYQSLLWSVGMCVVLVAGVLSVQFSPVILEWLRGVAPISKRLPINPLYRLIKKAWIVIILVGAVLATVHQSSLGAMWVLVPEKLYPLWYSLYLPVFFWISALVAGLTMPILESMLSSKALNRGLELDLLADLAKAGSVVLLVYLVARGVDLIARGAWPLVFEPNVQALAFWLEMGLGVIVPAILFAIKPLRYKPSVLFSGALMAVLFGIILNRLNVSIVGMWSYAGYVYFPSWMELAVTVTLITFAVIAFGMAAKYLPIFPEEHD